MLSKKKRRNVHIGLLEIHLNIKAGPEDEEYAVIEEADVEECAEDLCACLHNYLTKEMFFIIEGTRHTFEAQFELLSSKVDRIQVYTPSGLKREWNMHDALVERAEHAAEVAAAEEDGLAPPATERSYWGGPSF